MTAELLREAGAALHRAGVRFDLVLRIEHEVGVRFEAPAVDRGRHLLDGMARLARVLQSEGRSMHAKELAARCWPHEPVARVRGWLAIAVARGWLDHGAPPVGAGQGHGYVLGRRKDWQTSDATEAEQLRTEMARMQQRLAELSAQAVQRGAS